MRYISSLRGRCAINCNTTCDVDTHRLYPFIPTVVRSILDTAGHRLIVPSFGGGVIRRCRKLTNVHK